MDNAIDQGTAELIQDLTQQALKAVMPEGGNTPYVIIPADHKVVGLAEFIQNERSERPNRIKQSVEVWDSHSFISYFTNFRDANSRVFASINASTVTGILDYHEFRESVEGMDDNVPRWGSHKITLALKKSPEWLLWTSNNKKTMDQDAFATFIEDNAPDINDPSAATMKEIASDLHETHEMTFAGTAKAANGSVKLNYSQENKTTFGKQNADMLEAFKVAIPVYIGGGIVQLTARLRWRVAGGKVSFWYDILRADAAERAAFEAVRSEVAAAVDSVIINGAVG